MGNISGSLNLAKLVHAIRKSPKGVSYIAIPIEANHLILTEKGNVFINISCNEHMNEKDKQTHIVSQSLPKEVYETLKAKKEYAPTLGNLCDWDKLSGGGSGEGHPNSSVADIPEGDDDLPF